MPQNKHFRPQKLQPTKTPNVTHSTSQTSNERTDNNLTRERTSLPPRPTPPQRPARRAPRRAPCFASSPLRQGTPRGRRRKPRSRPAGGRGQGRAAGAPPFSAVGGPAAPGGTAEIHIRPGWPHLTKTQQTRFRRGSYACNTSGWGQSRPGTAHQQRGRD